MTILSGGISTSGWRNEAKQKPAGRSCGFFQITGFLSAVVTNGFDRTTFLGFLAELLLLFRARLIVNEGVATVIIAFEICRRCFAAEIAVDALVIDVIFSRRVVRI